MKHGLSAILALAGLSSIVSAQTGDVVLDGRIITAGNWDYDGDGQNDLVILNRNTGQIQAGFGLSGGGYEWRTVLNPFPSSFTGGISVAAGDVNGDGVDDLVIAVPGQPAVRVRQGARPRSGALAAESIHPVGPGPSGLALVDLHADAPGPELVVPLLAGLSPRTVAIRPQSEWAVSPEPLHRMSPALASAFVDFAMLPPGTPAAGQGRRDPLLAFCFKAAGGSSQLHVSRPGAAAAPAISARPDPWKHVTAARMRGPDGPGQFVLWSEGLDSLELVTAHQSPAGESISLESLAVHCPKVIWARQLPTSGGDRVAVGHDDGARVSILAWNSATNTFAPVQTLHAPPGRRFTNAAGRGNGGLFSMLDDGAYQLHSLDGAGQLVPAGGGVLPAAPAHGGHATITLYTDDPLSGKAFEFQSFSAGDWTTDAVLGGGRIHAFSEVFQSTLLGLGARNAITLTPFAHPGAAAQAQGNQFGDASSSLFFAGGTHADGDAAVTLAPASGTYVAEVRAGFSRAQPGTSVIYRLNGGAWQQAGPGGVRIMESAVLEYYGQAAGGALGSIRSATYEILPPGGGGTMPWPQNLRTALRDADNDRLDDAFELRAFNTLANRFDDDTDGDGFFNGEEYFLQTDPDSAASRPAGVTTAPRNIAITREGEDICVCWEGRPGFTYRVMTSTEMDSWMAPAPARQTEPGRFEWVSPAASSRMFIRVEAVFE